MTIGRLLEKGESKKPWACFEPIMREADKKRVADGISLEIEGFSFLATKDGENIAEPFKVVTPRGIVLDPAEIVNAGKGKYEGLSISEIDEVEGAYAYILRYNPKFFTG